MKKTLHFILFLFSSIVSAQNTSLINADLKLSDSLTLDSEIRIYAGGGITNYSSLFRMYKNKSKKWTAEFYEHYAQVDGQSELRSKKRTVESKNDMEFVWNSILRTNIESLPNMSEIKYKMRERGNVGLVDGEYQLMWNSKQIMDGICYKVLIKTELTSNEIGYDNPESYLKHYPEVDELVYFNELLSVVKNEFNIWKK